MKVEEKLGMCIQIIEFIVEDTVPTTCVTHLSENETAKQR